jgi:hypothetical protein
MSIATLILGESGTGKTCSLRNLDPAKTLLIQPVRKPLPFRSTGWKECVTKGDGGNIFVNDDPAYICAAMKKSQADVIVVDDFQYVLANLFMAKRNERGFDKFTSIAGAGFDICSTASQLAQDKRVYILAHTQTDDTGVVKIKTLGKLLDDKIVLEGLFTTVLRTHVEQGHYQFSTQNNGSDTVKSPLGMFEDAFIENDLALVDKIICDYYGIGAEPDPNSPDTGI